MLGFFSTDGQTANKRFEQVLKAIQEKDKQALKDMFCKQALTNDKNIDESITNLFDFFQGKEALYDDRGGPTVYANQNTGGRVNRKKEVQSVYDVKTTEQKYHFLVQEFTVDTENPDRTGGIYSICIHKVQSSEDLYYGIDKLGVPGITIDKKQE